jgi:hypothetical protein
MRIAMVGMLEDGEEGNEMARKKMKMKMRHHLSYGLRDSGGPLWRQR